MAFPHILMVSARGYGDLTPDVPLPALKAVRSSGADARVAPAAAIMPFAAKVRKPRADASIPPG